MAHAFAPGAELGLSVEEAAARLRAIGANRLVERDRLAGLRELASLLADPMAIMLAAAATVYLLLGETRDGVILLVALVPVLGVDVILAARSRSALAKLASTVAPQSRVIRSGREIDVPYETLVPGDWLVISEGDVLHADGVVRRQAHLTTDESPLTGEAEPQEKLAHAGPPDATAPATSRFYAGSLVLSGHGLGELTATGRQTRFGEIAHLVGTVQTEPTPLQASTAALVRSLAVVAVIVAFGAVGLEMLHGGTLLRSLLVGISLAMAAIPEEFPLVLTLFLSFGAWRLGQKGVLVRRLASVETLGSTTVICTDKTGTLTMGHFSLESHEPLGAVVSETELLEAAVLACEPIPADMLERVIVGHCREHGVVPEQLLSGWRLVHDYPFDPIGKHMSHVWAPTDGGDGRRRIVAKGALEGLLSHCAMTPAELAAAHAANAALAGQGARVLAVAGRWLEPSAADPSAGTAERAAEREADERDLRLYGLLGFRDPLRPEVPAAVAECQAAGIVIKLITGDNPITAHAVAEAAGIVHGSDGVVTGEDLDNLPPESYTARVKAAAIFARVRPEQKYAIVDALQRAGEVVAMAGDGINDAPALRRADIGVSMGKRATEVARAAADIVLLNDSFVDLVATVREGRHIFDNLQRAFAYVLGFHVPIVGLALLAPLLGLPLILLPVHMVWLELVVHPVSALGFEGEPARADLMARGPRDPLAPILKGRSLWPSVVSGIVVTAGALGLFVLRLGQGQAYARGCAMAVVVLGSAALIWAERAGARPWGSVPTPRAARFWAVLALVVVSLPLGMEVPALRAVLQIAQPVPRDWIYVVVLAAAGVVWRVPGLEWLGRKGAAGQGSVTG